MDFYLDDRDIKTKTLAKSHFLAPKHRTARVPKENIENIFVMKVFTWGRENIL